MKITKGKLKQIIAEEHAIVYGTKRRPQGRRRTTKKQRMNEARRELVLEIQSRAISNELLEEGFFDALKAGFDAVTSLGGKAASAAAKKAGSAAKAVTDQATALKKAAGAQIEALKDAGKDALAKVQEEYLEKYKAQIKSQIEEYTKELVALMKKADPDADDEAIKAQVSPIIMSAFTEPLTESIKGGNRMRLTEAKKARAQRRRQRRR